LGIIMLAVVLGLAAMFSGHAEAEGNVSAIAILSIAGKAFGIWLGFTVLGLVFSRQLASFLKLFRNSSDFSILAFGLALILAGFFERHGGLAMIIGAYIMGLSLSKTDIAAVVQGRLQGLYEFFVPMFFAIMGMMVNVRELFSAQVLLFGGLYTFAAIFAKVVGCGGPALMLGFNAKGALRIGIGMVPRGEVALIIAGIGLAMGVLDNQLFSIVILLTLISTVAAPPLLTASLKIKGQGTKTQVKNEENTQIHWDFHSNDVAKLMVDRLLIDIRAEGFFVQTMNLENNLALARKEDISLTISSEGSTVTVKTSKSDLPFVKNVVYEDIINLSESMQKLKDSMNTTAMKKELFDRRGRTSNNLLSLIEANSITLDLKGENIEEIIKELVDMLEKQGKLRNRELVLKDVFEREKIMSTNMGYGIVLPHAKTDGVKDTVVAVGIKKGGVILDPSDSQPSSIFILEISPRKDGPHLQFLSALGGVLRDESIRQSLIDAATVEEVASLLHHHRRA